MSKKSDSNLLKNVAGIAGILVVFVIILRAALTPLYQEVGQMERLQEQRMSQNGGGESSGGGGGSGENINIDLGGFGGLFNWALGWAWGGPGWYRGSDYGWWGANMWNGWRNWWNGGGNNRVWNGNDGWRNQWNGNVNDTQNREVNNEFRSDRFSNREVNRIRDDNDGGRRNGGDFRESRPEPRQGGGDFHGGESHGDRR